MDIPRDKSRRRGNSIETGARIRYATSIVNTWLAVEDVPLDLGPMQLLKNPVRRLTKAELLQNDGREALRVSQIDEYVAAHPDDVVTASINKGDLVIFDQYAYVRRAEASLMNRGDAAAAAWILRGDGVAAAPRPRRG